MHCSFILVTCSAVCYGSDSSDCTMGNLISSHCIYNATGTIIAGRPVLRDAADPEGPRLRPHRVLPRGQRAQREGPQESQGTISICLMYFLIVPVVACLCSPCLVIVHLTTSDSVPYCCNATVPISIDVVHSENLLFCTIGWQGEGHLRNDEQVQH